MQIIGCDLHTRQQTVAMLDTTTGEVVQKTLRHETSEVREFYSALPRPVRVGIEATGSMQWFVNLMEELGIECQVGHPAEIRAAEPRKQKHDRRDADLILKLLAENRFPAIWLPSKELVDLRSLLRMRTRVQNALQAIALANGLRRGPSLWSQLGQHTIASLPLAPHAAHRRSELQALYMKFETEIEKLNRRAEIIPKEYSSGGRQKLGGLSKQGNPLLRFLWGEAGAHAARRDPELKRFYRRKLIQKGLGKAGVAVARKLGIRLWIMLRDQIDYNEFYRRGQMRQKNGDACAGMPETGNGANSHRPVD
jgi:transposase